MSYSIDVNGNDNTPEWGTCKTPGCKQDAYPIWYSGGFPDEPDLLLCEAHIGARMKQLENERAVALAVIAAARLCLATLPSSPSMHDRLVALSTAIHVYDKATKDAPALSAETIADRARRFNALLGPGLGREASDG